MKSNCCNADIHYLNTMPKPLCKNCLDYCDIKSNKYSITISAILFIILIIIGLELGTKLTRKPIIKKVINTDVVLHKDSIYNELIKQEILFPELVIKQVMIETNHLKSNICINNKNLLGIKHIKQPLSIGKLNGHAKYNSYKDCIKDYKRLQIHYLKNIQEKYAEDKNYTKLLLTIK